MVMPSLQSAAQPRIRSCVTSAIDVEHGLAVIRGRTKVLCIQYRYINYRRDCNDVVKAQNIQMD